MVDTNIVIYYEYDPVTGQPTKAESMDLANPAIDLLFSTGKEPVLEIRRVAPTGKDPWLIFVDTSHFTAQPIPMPKAAGLAQSWGYGPYEIINTLALSPVYLPSFRIDN